MCVTVTDDGPGIPLQFRERVFENFFRIPGRDGVGASRAGAGLGLPIARRLVATQSGRMWIETTASGKGTTVVFTLPVAVEMATEHQVAAAVAGE